MFNRNNITKYATYEGYDSSYDYIVYDTKFVFNEEENIVEEIDEESEEIPNLDYTNFDLPGPGGNIH